MKEHTTYNILGQPLIRIQYVNERWELELENGCKVYLGSGGNPMDMEFLAPVDSDGTWLGMLNGNTIPDPFRSQEQVTRDYSELCAGVTKLFSNLKGDL